MTTLAPTKAYDRTTEDVGNIIELGHVNICIPDQLKAMSFYVKGLGFTRDPVLPLELVNVTWINVGREQFHQPTDPKAQVVRGTIGCVVPNLASLERRLESVTAELTGTQFAYERQ